MKTNQNIPLRLFVLSTLLLAALPQIIRRAPAAELRLTSDCVSNKFTLYWYGAPGFALQQTTNLAHPNWLDVPGSKGMSFCELPMTNPMAFFRVANIDAFTDVDADELDDHWETNGWEILIDAHGYGSDGLVTRKVSSDPSNADTDGDGIDDFWEWLLGTDPRAADTDGDGLSDYDEWFKWYTSPTSVDTDGDARGPNHNLPPKAQLFDGNELSLLHTSPTLDDTDGDGRTDYEEYDQPGRNPLVAQLPKLEVQLVDAVDIRLDVEYAEETGKVFEYGTELSQSTMVSHSDYSEDSIEASLTLGAQYQFGLGGGWTISGELSVGYGHVWSTTDETAETTENSYSQFNTDSRTRTEAAASGSMSGGFRLVNTGPVTYTLTDFGLTVRYWMPGGGNGTVGEFRTLATLVPALGADGLTLAPGDSTPVLQVEAKGLNVSRVKEFMARPNSLHLEPAFYELENAQGLNFDFLEEVTRWRTARVQIDYGNGTNEEYRIATNVGRNEDATYTGVTMGYVLSNILHVPFQTVARRTIQTNAPTNERVLRSVRDLVMTSPTNGFWSVLLSGSAPAAATDFEAVVLQAGDQILLTFVRDEDGDGLFAPEEQHYGTTEIVTPDAPPPADSDGDGLTDLFEVRTGWDVVVTGRTNHVYSDPRQEDQDADGLNDSGEYANGTDPTRADTDADGLTDGVDPWPLVPAKVVRVKWDAVPGGTNGTTWATAFTNLQDALSLARAGANTSWEPYDDIAEIWVAAGVYKPTTTTNDRNATFDLVRNTAIYGGFAGMETKLSQRLAHPLLNDTILSGDLLGNDTSTPSDDPATYSENSFAVCTANGSIRDGTILDGFTITGGNCTTYGGGLLSLGRPLLRNLFFRANYGFRGAGLFVWLPLGETKPYVISDCLFLQNGAASGGAMICEGQASLVTQQVFVITNCHFYENTASGSGNEQGGGAIYGGQATFEIQDCTFAWNRCAKKGGGLSIGRPAIARISRCEFIQNTANGGAGLCLYDQGSGSVADLKAEVLQSVFWGNTSSNYGGAIWAFGYNANKERLYVLSSTIVSNTAPSGGAALTLDYCSTWIENSIIWGNTNRVWTGSTATVRTTCLHEANSYPGNGNINAAPAFMDAFGGDLRLDTDSPCIDRGNDYVDYHPTIPGFQLIDPTDLDGNPRIRDGNGDHSAKVDMGAYELQEFEDF
jgi:hypothetical protein